MMCGTNFHIQSFVAPTYAALALEHPVLVMKVNGLCGLLCYIQGYKCTCSKVRVY
jgi:hypothetical protein